MPTCDADEFYDDPPGAILPFGGHKGSAIALMVELLSAGLVGDMFSFEAKMAGISEI